MNRSEARRWSKLIEREAAALEVHGSITAPRALVERTALLICAVDEIYEVDDLLLDFAAQLSAAGSQEKVFNQARSTGPARGS